MSENGNFGFPYSFLQSFSPLHSGAAISPSTISTPSFLTLPRFPLPRFQSSRPQFRETVYISEVNGSSAEIVGLGMAGEDNAPNSNFFKLLEMSETSRARKLYSGGMFIMDKANSHR